MTTEKTKQPLDKTALTIELHDFRQVKPPESGNYLVCLVHQNHNSQKVWASLYYKKNCGEIGEWWYQTQYKSFRVIAWGEKPSNTELNNLADLKQEHTLNKRGESND